MKQTVKDIIRLSKVKLIESDLYGSCYRAVILKAGETNSANKQIEVNGQKVMMKKYYTPEACKKAVEDGLFEGCPAILRSENEHLTGFNTGINQYVGNFKNAEWNEELQQVEADFYPATNSAFSKNFKTKLAEIWNATKDIGLSISGEGKYLLQKMKDYYLGIVTEICSMQSVDPVPRGNAGGKLVQLIESDISNNTFRKTNLGESGMDPDIKQKIYDLLLEAGLIAEGKAIDSISDTDLLWALYDHTMTMVNANNSTLTEAEKQKNKEALEQARALLTEALSNEVKNPPAPAATDGDDEGDSKGILAEVQKTQENIKKMNCRTILMTRLAESKLPQPVKDKVQNQFAGRVFEEIELTRTLIAEQDTLAKLNPNFVNNGGADVRVTADQVDNIQLACDYLLMPSTLRNKLSESEREQFKDFKGTHSIKELYRTFSGDVQVTGKIQKGSLAESISSTTWATILGNSMHRAMLAQYTFSGWDESWRNIARITAPTDYKANTRSRKGGYGDLPVVNEDAAYQPASTPGEESVNYVLLKRGYTETVSREAILNDDLKQIQDIALKWGEAAKRTLYKRVWGRITTNPTMDYDSKALVHADHNNIINAALDPNSYKDARIKLANQTEPGSNEVIGLTPSYLLVPLNLEEMAYQLTQEAWGKANNVPDFHQTFRVKPVVLRHLTDTNDWWLVADPMSIDIVELGFLFGNEEPEFFVQDDPRQGYTFSNDQIKYKVRHEYEAEPLDHRGVVGSVVAGG